MAWIEARTTKSGRVRYRATVWQPWTFRVARFDATGVPDVAFGGDGGAGANFPGSTTSGTR